MFVIFCLLTFNKKFVAFAETYPYELMLDAFSVPWHLNISWKRIGSYSMKCKYLANFTRLLEWKILQDTNHIPFNETISDIGVDSRSQNAIKFEMQDAINP